MYVPLPPFKDDRLQARYLFMVEGHLSPAQKLACGIRAVPGVSTTLAATQGAYRFLNNPRVRLPTLVKPLVEVAQKSVPTQCDHYVLAVHDWSLLTFRRHHSKLDRLAYKAGGWKEGYELHTTLLVSDRAGDPLAPVALSLHAADGVHCSRSREVRPALSVLDELDPAMTFIEEQRVGKPIVHIVDAEADSVAHYRQWSSQPQRLYLVRADDRLVEYNGQEQRCSAIQNKCRENKDFQHARAVLYHGRAAEQFIAQVNVRLLRPGQQNRANGSKARIAGAPLALRLVISEVRSPQGEVLATWFLLTNVPPTVDGPTIALWYYWRWRVESYFKLLKSAGLDLEQWGQETADAIARRLLVASMACVVVWQLAANEDPAADHARKFLIQLSGRQMKRGKGAKPYTHPALFAGLWTLLTLLHAFENYDLDTLRSLADLILPTPRAGPASKHV